jgi:tRNA modification GTPase
LSIDNKINIKNISAKEGKGIEELKSYLFEIEKDNIPEENSTFVTNFRHFSALNEASSLLKRAYYSLSHNAPSDLIAEDLSLALNSLGSISGEVTSEDILHHIFMNHCIGK